MYSMRQSYRHTNGNHYLYRNGYGCQRLYQYKYSNSEPTPTTNNKCRYYAEYMFGKFGTITSVWRFYICMVACCGIVMYNMFEP